MTFMYDVEHQLIGFATEGTTAAYRYDGLGRRIEKAVNGTLTRYLYDQEDILLTVDGANTLQAGVIHGPGIDQPLLLLEDADRDGTLSRGEPTRRLLADGLGSVTAVVDDRSGTLVERSTYESFGHLTILAPDGTVLPQSAVGNPYGFTGREVDAESDLHYFRARYYDPRTGRFLQEDPMGLAGGINKYLYAGSVGKVLPSSSLGANLYLYTDNNPVNFVDPLGLTKLGVVEKTRRWGQRLDELLVPSAYAAERERTILLPGVGPGGPRFVHGRADGSTSWSYSMQPTEPSGPSPLEQAVTSVGTYYNDPGRLLRTGGRVTTEVGYPVPGRLMSVGGLALEPGGTGKIVGIAAGGTAGAAVGRYLGGFAGEAFGPLGGIGGGIVVGYFGGWFGSLFDASDAGDLE